jgi:hypothetical protein
MEPMLMDVQAQQDLLADVGADKGADELFAKAAEDEGDGPSPAQSVEHMRTYLVDGRPSLEALWARVPLLRAQLVGFLDELDDFERSMPRR